MSRGKVRAFAEPCTVEGCTTLDYCREMCHLHYSRWLRTGSTHLVGRTILPPSTRFWSNVDKNGPIPAERPELGPCWLWTAGQEHGYGRFRGRAAHRWSWAEVNGPVRSGHELDHLCRNRVCVNPGHLEPVTHAENCRRAAYRRSRCSAGHPLAVVAGGRRVCRTCANRRGTAYKRRQPKVVHVRPVVHGRSRYVHQRCRCNVCIQAERDYQAGRKRALAAEPVPVEVGRG